MKSIVAIGLLALATTTGTATANHDPVTVCVTVYVRLGTGSPTTYCTSTSEHVDCNTTSVNHTRVGVTVSYCAPKP